MRKEGRKNKKEQKMYSPACLSSLHDAITAPVTTSVHHYRPCDGKAVCRRHEHLASLLSHPCWGEQQSEVSMATTISLAIKRAAISLLAILLQYVDWIWG